MSDKNLPSCDVQPEEAHSQSTNQSSQLARQPDVESSDASRMTVPIENVAEESIADKTPGPILANELTLAEKAAEVAREQAVVAADALRRGELMQNAIVDPEASNDDRLIALLSYISQIVIPFGLPVLALLSASSQKRPFQRYHAVQSMALTGVFLVVGVALVVSSVILQIIPVVGTLLGWMIFLITLCLFPIAVLMYWIAHLYYGYQAYQGKRFAIPGLTSVLRDQGWVP